MSRSSLVTFAWLTALAVGTPQRAERSLDAQETFPVEVRIRTELGARALSATGSGSVILDDRAAAPGIHVAFGVVSADSSSDEGRPRYLDLPVLAEAVSDETGWIRVTVPVPLEWRERRARLWARVETPGYLRIVSRLSVPPEPGEQRISVRPGATLVGRVLTSDGAPAEGAAVFLVGLEESTSLVCETKTRANGTFVLDPPPSGRLGLHARSSLGSSAARELEPGPRPATDIELVLRGAAPLRGRLLSPHAEPVPGAWVCAVRTGLGEPPTPAECFLAEREGGLCWSVGRTDLDGAFALPALPDGTYRIFASFRDQIAQRSLEGLGTALTRLELTTPREEVPLLFREPWLEISVLGEDGRSLLPHAPPKENPYPYGPDSPALEVRDTQDGYPVQALALGSRTIAPVEAGHEYLVSWKDPYLERLVTVGEDAFRIPILLRPDERGVPGTLYLRVLDPEGAEYSGAVVSILSENGQTVATTLQQAGWMPWNRLRGASWSTSLPPGRYLARASSRPLLGCVIPSPIPSTPFVDAEAEVEIRSDEPSRVELRFRVGGTLEFVGVSAAKRPFEMWAERRKRSDPMAGTGAVYLASGPVRIPAGSFEVDRMPQNRLLPGWSARGLDALPVGAWTLRVEDQDGLLFEAPIRIEAGQVTRIEW